MDYDTCAELFHKTKMEIAVIDGNAAAATAPLKEKLSLLLQWMETKAREDGLSTVKTKHGTGYWTIRTSASVAAPSLFMDHVIKNCSWDLLESRANKTAVKSYIEANKEPPPGVNYNQVSVFNIRAPGEK